MSKSRLVLGLVCLGLIAFSGCNISVVALRAPDKVVAGQIFELTVDLSFVSIPNGSLSNTVAIVVQHPSSTTVLDAVGEGVSLPEGGFQLPANQPFASPALALFTAQPGNSLAVFATILSYGTSATTSPRLVVRFRAPSTPGPLTFKVATADNEPGNWVVRSPAGVGNFAANNAPAFTRTITIVPAPTVETNAWVEKARVGNGFMSGNRSVKFDDLNGDGLIDAVVAAHEPVYGPDVWLRNLSGGWTRSNAGIPSLFSLTFNQVTTGDFNGDGRRDLATSQGHAYLGSPTGAWIPSSAGLPNSTGASMPPPLPPSTLGVSTLDVGDVNGDGLDDIVIAQQAPSYALRLFLASPSGAWTETSGAFVVPPTTPPFLPVTSGTVLVRDIDQDGDLDIVWGRDGTPGIYFGDGTGNFTPASTPQLASQIQTRIGDLDGDGDLDFVLLSLTGSIDVYFQQPGPGQPQWVQPALPTGLPPAVNSAAALSASISLIDVDQNGLLDLILCRPQILTIQIESYPVEVWFGNGSGQFALAPTASISGLPDLLTGRLVSAESVDIDVDGTPEIAYVMTARGVEVLEVDDIIDSCSDGTTGANIGGPSDVLFIDSSAHQPRRVASIPVSTPFTISVVTQAVFAAPAPFVIWGRIGDPTPATVVDHGAGIGATCFVPHVLGVGDPSLFTLASSFGPDPLALVPSTVTPWTFPVLGGVPIPLVLTLQGVVLDPSAGGFGISITNAIVLDIR